MRLCEISNPSDPYTIEVDDDPRPACAAVLLLGEGHYGLHEEGGEDVMPIFLFGGAVEWLAKHGVPDLATYIAEHLSEIADALDTVMIGKRSERARMERVLAEITSAEEDREKARAAWLDEKQTSLNDIGGRAVAMAKRMRDKAARVASGTDLG